VILRKNRKKALKKLRIVIQGVEEVPDLTQSYLTFRLDRGTANENLTIKGRMILLYNGYGVMLLG